MFRVPSARRANLPSKYDFSLVSDPPPSTPTACLPNFACTSLIALTMRSYASSQDTGRCRPAALRANGCSNRSGWLSPSAKVQPLIHNEPRLQEKNSFGPTTGDEGPPWIIIPHWSAQYGQCVATDSVLYIGNCIIVCLSSHCV